MSSRSRALALFAVPLAFSFALTSCQDGNDPAATTSPSESPAAASPTASPSPTKSQPPKPVPASAEGPAKNIPVPEMPDAAKQNSKNGAISFAEHYFDVVNYSFATTTTDELKKLTSRSCKLCGERLIDPIDSAQRNGAWQVGGQHDYQLIDLLQPTKNRAVAIFDYSVDSQEVYAAPNEVVRKWRAAKNRAVSFELEFNDGWKVKSLVTPKG